MPIIPNFRDPKSNHENNIVPQIFGAIWYLQISYTNSPTFHLTLCSHLSSPSLQIIYTGLLRATLLYMAVMKSSQLHALSIPVLLHTHTHTQTHTHFPFTHSKSDWCVNCAYWVAFIDNECERGRECVSFQGFIEDWGEVIGIFIRVHGGRYNR